MALESFEKTHIAGVRHLIDLALSSPHPDCPRLIFLSSIAAVAKYRGGSQVPEVAFEDPSITGLGYGLSKFVGERIIDNAVRDAGLNGTVIRIGQLSGATCGSGAWSRTEQYPILFMSSVAMGVFPIDLPPVRWTPVDVAARVIISQSFYPKAKAVEYFHLENPDLTSWQDIAGVAATYHSRRLQFVSMQEWIDQVKRLSREPRSDANKIPAARLLEFYETQITMPVLNVDRTLELGPELRFGPIRDSMITKYLEYLGL